MPTPYIRQVPDEGSSRLQWLAVQAALLLSPFAL